jgi:uncharacterized protein (UPF0332 family)
MKTKEIHLHWLSAQRNINSARLLFDAEMFENCVSDAYYAILHAGKAALLTQGIVPKSHTALKNLFGEFLINQDRIEEEWAKILAKEQRLRISVDYGAGYVVEEDKAKQYLDDAERFMNRMAEYLLTQGVDVNSPPGDI